MPALHNHGTMYHWRPCSDPECGLCFHHLEDKMCDSTYFVNNNSILHSGSAYIKPRCIPKRKPPLRRPDDMLLEEINLAVDLELQAKMYIGIREAIRQARQLFARKTLEGKDLSRKEKIGMFVTLLRSENFYPLSSSYYISVKYSEEINQEITREVKSIRVRLFDTNNWSDIGVFKTTFNRGKIVANADHWGSRALKELAEDQMNVDDEFREMRKNLVAMDVATKDVSEINRKASDVIKGLCEVAEDLVGA